MYVTGKDIISNIRSSKEDSKVDVSDITLCYTIRVNEVNPWVIERLKFALSFYDPKPNVLVIDFGSQENYAKQIEDICNIYQAELIYIEDYDVFSSSKARNAAFLKTKTDFILFADIDFIYEQEIFSKLASLANKLDLRSNPRKVLSMPIFHVNKKATENFESLSNNNDKEKLITKWGFDGFATEFGSIFEFVAPYSNTFFLHRDMFDIAGGLCDEFRGHGSEDFDFLIRLAKLSTNIPISDSLLKDFYGPLKDSFWGDKEYLGFRRYLEAFTLPSESLGLKAFHLWHEKPSHKGYWTRENDWKRLRFNEVVNRYIDCDSKLLSVDYLRREKNALCIFSDIKHWGYFIPLRLAGYSLSVLNKKNDDSILNSLNEIESGKYQRIFIFNPYMKSHVVFRGVIDLAKKLGVPVTIIERGGLPNSLYYSDEVAYGDAEYTTIFDNLERLVFTDKEKSIASGFIESLKQGGMSLESMSSYSETWKKHTLLRHIDRKKVFIPLQLRDDMAVNFFTAGFPSYADFEEGIRQAVINNPNIIYIIKQHPLSKYDLSWTDAFENITCASQDDNIHALIEISDAVCLYNSGVGLLALAHMKQIYHIGNAYYAAENNFAIKINSVTDIEEHSITTNSKGINHKKVKLFFTWLIFRKYSWFTAQDIIRDFSDRKSHAYDNISIEILNLEGKTYYSGSDLNGYQYSHRSYLNWHLNINSKPNPKVKKSDKKAMPISTLATNLVKEASDTKCQLSKMKEDSIRKIKTPLGNILIPIIKVFVSSKMKNKIVNSPYLFFMDSKYSSMKMIGKISFK